MDKSRKQNITKITKQMLREFGNTYFEIFTNSELLDIVNESNLSEYDRQIVILKKTQGLTYEQIADKLGITTKTCFSRMATIQMKLLSTCIKLFIYD